MKRIIDGKTYNTETATKAAYSRRNEDLEYQDEFLYVTRGGAFFLHIFDQMDENGYIRVLTKNDAHGWIMSGEVEIYTDVFGEPPEVEAAGSGKPEATIYVRVPEPLKRRIDAEAKETSQSINAWAMRCLERCLRTDQAAAQPSKEE